jgi:uncharacterized protein DUF2635
MYVVPKPGLTIVDPDRKDVIPPEGREVPDQPYWFRRLQDGDATRGPLPEPASAEAPAPVAVDDAASKPRKSSDPEPAAA